MIRPVTNEESLQNLEQMEENDFRADFLEQVALLRKKVTHCVKPKTLNGKQLSPSMFVTLAENYVNAINEGAVPNIENAWTYICQNEAKKSLENSINRFDDFINEEIIHRIPMEEKEIREMYREAKEDCVKSFTKSCVGGVIDEYMEELKFQLRNKFDKLMDENERECRNQCTQFLDFGYTEIDNQLKKGEFKDFYQFEEKLREFEQYFYYEGPPGPCRNECLLDFINK